MNYTNWLLATYPDLAEKSSAETFRLVETARSETHVKRIAVNFFAIFLAAVVTHMYLLPALGLVPFDGVVAWLVLVGVLAFSALIASMIERHMVRKALTSLVEHTN